MDLARKVRAKGIKVMHTAVTDSDHDWKHPASLGQMTLGQGDIPMPNYNLNCFQENGQKHIADLTLDLDKILGENGIGTLAISGLMTQFCVEFIARPLLSNGIKVIGLTDLTFVADPGTPTGWSQAEWSNECTKWNKTSMILNLMSLE